MHDVKLREWRGVYFRVFLRCTPMKCRADATTSGMPSPMHKCRKNIEVSLQSEKPLPLWQDCVT